MANFKATKERTRAGNFIVRYRDGKTRAASGLLKKFHYITIDKTQRATIKGKLLVGANLANAYVTQCEEDYHKNRLGDFDSSAALVPLIEQYIEERENHGLSPRTTRHDQDSLGAFVRENQTVRLSGDLTKDAIELWLNHMRRAGYAGWTIDGRLSNLRTFCKWLAKQGKVAQSPFEKGLMPKRKQTEPKYYTAGEFKALDLALAEIHFGARLACQIMHGAGLRKAELVGHAGDPATSDRVQWEDITWNKDGAELLIRKELTKTNRSRTVPLDPGIVAMLGSRRSGPIIPFTRYQIDHYFNRGRKLSGIKIDLDIHGLRHTFAKNYLQRGEGNLASLKELMGHASIVSTMIYAQFEKSYFRTGVNLAYERRIVEENLAGQDVTRIGLAGQMEHTLSKQSALGCTPLRVDAPEITGGNDLKVDAI